MTSKVDGLVFRAAGEADKHNDKPDSSDSSSAEGGENNDNYFDQGHGFHDTDLSKEDGGGKEDKNDDGQPAGGFDDTPVPKLETGYTLKFTFHKATNLPMADINSFSSDPYIYAQLYTSLPQRHKEDPPLRLRTPTVSRDTEPKWNTEWIVANVPASGFKLKCRIYDEDPADHDDRLGNATIEVQGINDEWPGIQEQAYKIKKRMGSKRAYLMRGIAVALQKTKHMDGSLFVSVENLGRTKDDDGGGRCYTVGPMWYIKHYSPMLGRLTGKKEAPSLEDQEKKPPQKKKAERYNFQANQFQMRGPVPLELYHRFVEFKPFVKRMFTSSGVQGFLLSKALHHQHARVYNFGRTTEYGVLGEQPSTESTVKFLDLVHWDEGGRIFTYVLTLDALFRFTETGQEFGIDFLSKHTMHSDVNIYIAFSGEFFVRRLAHKHRLTPEEHLHNPPDWEEEQKGDDNSSTSSRPNTPYTPGAQSNNAADKDHPAGQDGGESSHHQKKLTPHPGDQTEEHPPSNISGGPPKDDPPRDPRYYELVIDNDSGTYRPNAKLLPILKKYLRSQFPGLHIAVLDCQEDEELQQRMKKEQREKKKSEGQRIVYRQASMSSGSSISSSDLSDLDDMENDDNDDETRQKERGTWKALGYDAKSKGKARKRHWGLLARGRDEQGGLSEKVMLVDKAHAGTEGEKSEPARVEAMEKADSGVGGQDEHTVQSKEVPVAGGTLAGSENAAAA